MSRPRLSRLINLVSATLFVLLAALCIKSYFQRDCLAWAWTAEHHLNSDHGYVLYERILEVEYHLDKSPPTYSAPQYASADPDNTESHPLPSCPQFSHDERPYAEDNRPESLFGFSYTTEYAMGHIMAGTQYQTLIIPYWAPLVLTVIAPLVALMCFLLSKRTGPAFEILPLQKDAGP